MRKRRVAETPTGWRRIAKDSSTMIISSFCEGCNGDGVRAPATPSCHVQALKQGWMIVERCDACQVFSDDFAAAQIVGTEPRWVRCEDGGWHVIARCLRTMISA
jgi:hypothetical protein